VRDDARATAPIEGDDRVEPARARVAADDVCRVTDRCCGLVRARLRQVSGRCRRGANDLVELRDAVAATEDVGVAGERRSRRVMDRCR